eukprot:6507548-Prorocentrum_lima.AAC.1
MWSAASKSEGGVWWRDPNPAGRASASAAGSGSGPCVDAPRVCPRRMEHQAPAYNASMWRVRLRMPAPPL